jgi:hypothetical protein
MRSSARRGILLLQHVAHCTFAVTVAAAFSVNVQLLALLPPLEQAPDQIASRPFETLSVIAVPVANDAEPVLPLATLMPAGLEVIRSPLRPLAVTVSVAAAGGGADGSACTVKLRTLDHAPSVPAELMPRTRHQCWTAASDPALNCDAGTTCSTTRGAVKPLESSIWIR